MTRNQPPAKPRTDQWLLDELEDNGAFEYAESTDPHSAAFTSAWVIDYRRVKALEMDQFRGKMTRVDLVETPHGPAKRVWLAGWMPGDPANLSGPLKPGHTIESVAADLEAQGWKVRRWDGGARCWRVDYRPVRTGRRLEYARELFRKQGKRNMDNQALLLDY